MEEELSFENIFKYIQISYTNNFEAMKARCKKFMAENRKNLDEAKLKALPAEILADILLL